MSSVSENLIAQSNQEPGRKSKGYVVAAVLTLHKRSTRVLSFETSRQQWINSSLSEGTSRREQKRLNKVSRMPRKTTQRRWST